MKIENLFLVNHFLNSDEDASVIEDLYVGYTPNLKLVIVITHTDYDKPRYNCTTYAEIGKNDSYRLAQRLRVSMKQLPSFIADSMSDYLDIVNPTPSDVRECFGEILECLTDEKCKFRIVREQSKNGFITC